MASWRNPRAPRPVFNGKKNYGRSNSNHSNHSHVPHDPITPQHEELVRFVSDSWQRIQYEYDLSNRRGDDNGPVVYQEKNPCQISGFEPFDLEQWWGNRTLAKIQQS